MYYFMEESVYMQFINRLYLIHYVFWNILK